VVQPAGSEAPRWLKPLLGRVPEGVEVAQLRLLGMVALALLFEEYDTAMLISALKYIAQDLGMPGSELGLYLALVRLGAVPAFLIVPLGDRIGRRPIFIGSTVTLGLLTFATAFVQSPLQFVVLQALARTFFVAGTAVAFVIVAEELPAHSRGWGIGLLGALGALGHGLGAALFSQVDRLPFGWRALYGVGLVPVLCMPLFLLAVRETGRFAAHRRSQVSDGGRRWGLARAFAPIGFLFSHHALRAVGLSVCGFLVAAAALPSFQFSGYFTQTKLQWTPGEYSAMVIAAGAVGILGNVVAGRLGDRFGRKGVGFTMLALFPLASFVFYHGTSWVVVTAWIPLVFCSMGGRVILRALSTELFPTSHRSAAAGMFTVMESLGAVGGLLIVHVYGTANADDIARIVSTVALAVLVTAMILLLFPETKRRELEELSVHH
jgi:MFS family permease